jgi:CRISPR-associated endoribonuclease Cas6
MTADEVIAPDIYSISVTLEPVAEAVIPQTQGYHAYALFLNLLRASNLALAEELHALDGPKPFTVSPLQGKFRRAGNGIRLLPNSKYFLRLTFLRSDVLAHFLDGALRWGDNMLELGSASLRMEEIETLPIKDPTASFQSYQGLLEGASAERQIELEFLSPTAFRSGGKRNVVFPEPELVFGSYLNRWQAFSPVRLDDSISSWLDRMVVARYKLESRILNFGSYQEVGFTGRCRFEVDRNTPEKAVLVLNALADFAFYCGTGAKTTMGMGQTRTVRGARNTKWGLGSDIVPEMDAK